MSEKLITRARLAEICGVSKAAITQAIKRGMFDGALDDMRVDISHPKVSAYIAGKGASTETGAKPEQSHELPEGFVKRGRKTQPQARKPKPTTEPEQILDYADMPLRDIIAKFGTEIRFTDWLKALKSIEDIHEKRIKNEQTTGGLVSRELVEKHVFGVIEASHRRLLNDSPKTITGQLYAAAKAGTTLEDAEAIVRELIGAQLKAVKSKAVRALRDGS